MVEQPKNPKERNKNLIEHLFGGPFLAFCSSIAIALFVTGAIAEREASISERGLVLQYIELADRMLSQPYIDPTSQSNQQRREAWDRSACAREDDTLFEVFNYLGGTENTEQQVEPLPELTPDQANRAFGVSLLTYHLSDSFQDNLLSNERHRFLIWPKPGIGPSDQTLPRMPLQMVRGLICGEISLEGDANDQARFDRVMRFQTNAMLAILNKDRAEAIIQMGHAVEAWPEFRWVAAIYDELRGIRRQNATITGMWAELHDDRPPDQEDWDKMFCWLRWGDPRIGSDSFDHRDLSDVIWEQLAGPPGVVGLGGTEQECADRLKPYQVGQEN